MGSRGRLLFDLNEPPAEDDEESDHATCVQPQKALPSANPHASDLFVTSSGSQRIVNNHAFSHASTGSGFQPFIRPTVSPSPEVGFEPKRAGDQNSDLAFSSSKSNNSGEIKAHVVSSSILGSANAQVVEKEEGEWSDAEGSADVCGNYNMNEEVKASQEEGVQKVMESNALGATVHGVCAAENSQSPLRLDQNLNEQKGNSVQVSEGNVKSDMSIDGQEEPGVVSKQREVKGIEASYALKCANNPVKRKIDQQKEAMLGKKRNRKTMFLNLEDVKQAGPIKTSTPRRQNFPTPVITRTVKEVRTNSQSGDRAGEKQVQPLNEDQKQVDLLSNHTSNPAVELYDSKSECNGDTSSGLPARPRRLNSDIELSESHLLPIPRQSSWKQPMDSRQVKNLQFSNRKPAPVCPVDTKMVNKKHISSKKTTTSYQDTSVERLIREVTSEKFWHHPVIHVPSIITL